MSDTTAFSPDPFAGLAAAADFRFFSRAACRTEADRKQSPQLPRSGRFEPINKSSIPGRRPVSPMLVLQAVSEYRLARPALQQGTPRPYHDGRIVAQHVSNTDGSAMMGFRDRVQA